MEGHFALDDFIQMAVLLGGQEMKIGTGGGFDKQVIWFLETLPPAAGQDDIHVAVGSLRKCAVGNTTFIKYNTAIWIKIRFHIPI